MKMQSEGGAIFLELALSVGILVTVLFGMVEFFVNSRVQQDLIVVSEEIALESLRSCSHETDSNVVRRCLRNAAEKIITPYEQAGKSYSAISRVFRLNGVAQIVEVGRARTPLASPPFTQQQITLGEIRRSQELQQVMAQNGYLIIIEIFAAADGVFQKFFLKDFFYERAII